MAKKKKKAKDDDEKPKKGKKAKPVEEEEEEDEYSPEEAAKPRLDIYVVDAAKGKTPPQVAVNVGSIDGRPAPAPR
jgi:hypothetical protein